jgi:hypothetical protein
LPGEPRFSDVSRILFPLTRAAVIYLARMPERPAPLWRRFATFGASAQPKWCGVRLIPEVSIFPLAQKKIGQATLSSALSCTAWGFSCDLVFTKVRWALTPPFQPYPAPFWRGEGHCWNPATPTKMVRGGIFSVILSVIWSFRPKSPRFSRGMLPCGVRTFLWHNKGCTSDHPSQPYSYHKQPRSSTRRLKRATAATERLAG